VEVVALRGGPPHRLPSRPAPALCRAILRQHWRTPRYCLSLLRHAGQAAALAEHLRGVSNAHILAQFAWTTADVARMAAALAAAPFSVRVHAWDVFTQSRRALRRRMDSATAVLPCSQAAADAVRACGYPAPRIAVVHHGLPLDDPAWAWRPPTGSTRIVGIGRLVPKKGIDVLLDACALLLRDDVDFALEWIGDGPEETRLRRLANALGLERHVHFAGALPPDECRNRLRAAGLLVLPSLRLPDGDSDGIANVLVEAMALGVPVVTTTAGAAPEVITHGVNGLLVAPDDAAALATALRKCLDFATDRAAMSRAARQTVEREFDLSVNTRALLAAITSAADTGGETS
jgi:glycosyltransferase involved in cell wall biosynthesis